MPIGLELDKIGKQRGLMEGWGSPKLGLGELGFLMESEFIFLKIFLNYRVSDFRYHYFQAFLFLGLNKPLQNSVLDEFSYFLYSRCTLPGCVG